MGSEDCLGKKAVVTGAGSGIGRAVARMFTRKGGDVACLDLNGAGLEETAALIKKESPERTVRTCVVDVTHKNDVVSALDSTGFDRVDVLFNVAGIIMSKPIVDHDIDDLVRLMTNNVGSILVMVATVAPRMTGGGVVVNTSSSAAFRPNDGLGVYGASKAAVVFMTKALARELADSGIRVCAVAPGGVNTPMPRHALEGVDDPEGLLRQVIQETQLVKSLAEPEDVATLMGFLATDGAAYVSGATVLADGGADAR